MGDGPRVPQAKTERDVDFAWYPNRSRGPGEREKVANLREREKQRESETLCIVVWAPSLSNSYTPGRRVATASAGVCGAWA